MKTRALSRDELPNLSSTLKRSALFATLSDSHLELVLENAQLLQLDPGEFLAREGEPSDSFFVIVRGSPEVLLSVGDESMTVATLSPGDVVGETGLLLQRERGASVLARQQIQAVRIKSGVFHGLTKRVPEFTLAMCRLLAQRLADFPVSIPEAEPDEDTNDEPSAGSELLDRDFCIRHRVVVLKLEGDTITLGFVDRPEPALLRQIRDRLPSLTMKAAKLSPAAFEAHMKEVEEAVTQSIAGTERITSIDVIFERMVAHGASDLHLSAATSPCWRIDGDIDRIPGFAALGGEEVLELMEPTLTAAAKEEFAETNDIDYAYALDGVGRFRLNLFRDNKGICAVARHIPQKILTLEQLGTPPIVERLCSVPKGMVLVTGPTGSGKSTTLAGMIDHINATTKGHILTLEDPVEFVHENKGCLINQRDIGSHTQSFGRALKAALREDPDVVLVGEMRDLETIALAMEIANTGHLVFGTLHTATAISTVDRIIDQFPAEQQNQVRTVLSECLKGVLSQTLCKKIGGGRVAAIEVMVVNAGVANMIRQGKTHQIANILATSRALGNQLLSDELIRLVKQGKITKEEAMSRAAEPSELAPRLGLPSPE